MVGQFGGKAPAGMVFGVRIRRGEVSDMCRRGDALEVLTVLGILSGGLYETYIT